MPDFVVTPAVEEGLAGALDARFNESMGDGRMRALPDFSKALDLAKDLYPKILAYYTVAKGIIPDNVTTAVDKTATAVQATADAVTAILAVVHPA